MNYFSYGWNLDYLSTDRIIVYKMNNATNKIDRRILPEEWNNESIMLLSKQISPREGDRPHAHSQVVKFLLTASKEELQLALLSVRIGEL